jgi:putative hemolysin
MPLIVKQDLMHTARLNWFGGKKIAELLMSMFKFNKINDVYEKHVNKTGIDFIRAILKETGINYNVSDSDTNRILSSGPFIIVSNHPYGGVEGLILLDILNKIRPDLKIIGNFIFHKVEPLKEYIFSVNPFENFKNVSSLTGLKDALCHLENGKPLLIFPAGEVSTWYPGNSGIMDKKWNNSALKFIKKANVPVIPVHFKGTNSTIFHLLGMIHPVLRTAKIPSELFNKKDKKVYIRIGNVISTIEQERFTDISRYGRYLRARTYALDTAQDVKKFFFPTQITKQNALEIAAPMGGNHIRYEIETLPAECFLFAQKSIKVYCAPSVLIPNVIYEIGRLREITFREIGEGTNLNIDLDDYDLYYHHLFIWDDENNRLVGAYRIGKGREIIEQYGAKGFYVRSLFKFKREFFSLFKESIELGRSFIVKEYQKNPMALFLLWKGILYFLLKNPEYRYLIGPVSISNSYSEVSKHLIINYIQNKHFDHQLGQFVKPRKCFRVHLPHIDTEILTSSTENLISLDKLIGDIEQNKFRIPVLLKKYIQLNGKILSFNIDPKFNNCLDGLLMLDYYDVPEETLKYLSREFEDEEIKERLMKPRTIQTTNV